MIFKKKRGKKKRVVLNFRSICLYLRFRTSIYYNTYLSYPGHFCVNEAGEFPLALMPLLRSLPSQRIDPELIEVNGNYSVCLD